ncbi:MAG: helix-turn-helix transcriptional regulator [Flavobacteriaceae bacterium]|nr:helix-turn-helix transcriptional regulator [Flavobacteriaceae bacterium]
MITLNITEVFNARGIDKGYNFMIKHGISPGSAKTLLHKAPRTIRLDHIEILCKNLVCEPSDLFTYTPDKNNNLPGTHPLNKLIRNKEEASLKQTISHLSYRELLEIKNFINTQKSTPSVASTEEEQPETQNKNQPTKT